MILLEGPDRCGKTTVAKALLKLLPTWTYRHHGVPPGGDAYDYFARFLADAPADVIVDRLHYSELAYAVTYRSGTTLTPAQWRALELALLARQTLVLVLTDDPANIRARWSKAEAFGDSGIESLVEQFRQIPYAQGDYGTLFTPYAHRLSSLVKPDSQPARVLIEHALIAANSVAHLDRDVRPARATGNLTDPAFLVVGEGTNDVRDLLPWAVGPGADCLWGALARWSIPVQRGAYTNAERWCRNGEEFERFVNEGCRARRVVALGRAALALVQARADRFAPHVRVIALPHPAFVSRFHRSLLDQWKTDFAAACDKGIAPASGRYAFNDNEERLT